ncbi:hypothetical protein PVAND_009149 [Polypedilum vanderplanki]|uniref:Uncharacterized protein n=1 Tax=Polypedilum vanderplanki TaxID=319348 RepID=A0A9J6CCE6_POLVA|nr:hypothetical protein PVAND_009149 [Polypedilum vanderplanki]
MKILFAILITTISIVYGLFHYREIKGCEKSKLPPNTFIETCCPTLPHYQNWEIFIKCNRSCSQWLFNPTGEGSRKCCMVNCTYVEEGVMEKFGPFQSDKFIEAMQRNLTYINASWSDTITNVVKKCEEKATNIELHDTMSNCETDNITLALNITLCIRREMFFACNDPPMKQSRCQSLIEFGKGCNYWPWQCNHKRKHEGNFKNVSKPPGTR